MYLESTILILLFAT